MTIGNCCQGCSNRRGPRGRGKEDTEWEELGEGSQEGVEEGDRSLQGGKYEEK